MVTRLRVPGIDGARLTRAGAVVTLAVAGLLLAAASVAFACTGQAQLHDITPSRALPGETVTVGGNLFGDQPVELRLDSPNGVLLATAHGPSFNMPVQIPSDVAPGPHYIVAVVYDSVTDAIAEQRAKGFEVLDPKPAPDPQPQPQPQPPESSDPMTTPGADTPAAPETSTPAPMAPDTAPPAIPDAAAPSPSTQQPAAGPDDAPAPAPVAAAPQPAEGQPVNPGASGDDQRAPLDPAPAGDPQPAASAPSTPSGSTAQPAADPSAPQETAAPAQQETAAAEPTGQDRQSASVQARRPDTDVLAGADTDAPSARSGGADLWSGFAADDAALAPGIDAPAAAGDAGMGQVALAAGLLGAGLIVLVAAGTTLVVRRRRVLVPNRASEHRDA